jgi:hypothetical protein
LVWKVSCREVHILVWIACGSSFLCLWFCASLMYINNCPTRCNTKQSIYYFPSNVANLGAWPRWREVAAQKIWPVPEAAVTFLCTDNRCG